MSNSDFRTTGIVLRRTNYGEADRILNILTPEGKISVIAKGARKAKSKLAGGIEMFCVSDIVVHRGKGNLDTLISAKMIHFYKNIMADLAKLDLASKVLKRLSRVSEDVDSIEYFNLLQQTLDGIDTGVNLILISLWFELNFAKINGEEFNLYTDCTGAKLQQGQSYIWDRFGGILVPDDNGPISTNEIKLARLMVSSKLKLVAKIKDANQIAENICAIIV